MYAEFYRLSGRPFQLSPNHRFFFGSKGHRRAMSYLTYGLHQGEGFIVVTGDVGTGKTTLVGYLCEQLGAGPFVAARIDSGRLGADDVVRALVEQHLSGRRDHAAALWSLLMFESFLRRSAEPVPFPDPAPAARTPEAAAAL